MEHADEGRAPARSEDSLAITSFTRTLRLKVKPESYAWLSVAAMEVNTVWNWGAEVSEKAARPCTGKRKWLSGFDLCALSSGASEYFEKIGADTIQRVACEYAMKRSTAKRIRLRWRVSLGEHPQAQNLNRFGTHES
jgi:hypothetical protein